MSANPNEDSAKERIRNESTILWKLRQGNCDAIFHVHGDTGQKYRISMSIREAE